MLRACAQSPAALELADLELRQDRCANRCGGQWAGKVCAGRVRRAVWNCLGCHLVVEDVGRGSTLGYRGGRVAHAVHIVRHAQRCRGCADLGRADGR